MATRARSALGPRADAEPTAGLPTLRPGVDRLPTCCPRCGSTWLGSEESVGVHQRGMLWCQTCSRSICWLADGLSSLAPRRASPDLVLEETTAAPALAAPSVGGPARVEDCRIETGCLLVDVGRAEVRVVGSVVALTATERLILEALARQLDYCVRYPELIREVWGPGWSAPDAMPPAVHALRVFLSRLRGKLGPAAELITTIPGIGLRLVAIALSAAPPEWSPPQRLRASRIGAWSLRWDACRCCGTTSRTHNAQGYCNTCYGRRLAAGACKETRP